MFLNKKPESSACGVGFLADRNGIASHSILRQAIHALSCVEHRGACSADQLTGDGAGLMADIPFDIFHYEPGSIAIATLFMPTDKNRLRLAIRVFEETFSFLGLDVIEYRDVPVDTSVLGSDAKASLPTITHAVIRRPKYCRTDESFNARLYAAKQLTRTKERESGIVKEFFFTSLSTTTIVYKALTQAADLARFYLDLQNPAFTTRFALFHRRFSTNTKTSWDKAQPFRLIAHNGEINTIAGNRGWSYAREQSLGLPVDELLTHEGISDSGSLNEMVEALKYRSSIPHVEDVLAIMIPPADHHNAFYRFWSRAMEPWDGPAFISYSDGETIGARLDRNGFRPCRWTMTKDNFFLCSEAGAFEIPDHEIVAKGTLHAGSGVTVELRTGAVHFEDPSRSRENFDARFDSRLLKIDFQQKLGEPELLDKKQLFSLTSEELEEMLIPMITEGKEPIGSMGETARPAILSAERRSFFDYFYHDFAQVTNPPLDYLREEMVTDLLTFVGRRPNIFAPKELIPPMPAVELPSPVLNLSQMAFFEKQVDVDPHAQRIAVKRLAMTFQRVYGATGFRSALRNLAAEACRAVNQGYSVIVLSDRDASPEFPPLPSLLALRAVSVALTREGISLHASILVETAEVRSTHQLAALIGFGATAVCPSLALEIARFDSHKELQALAADTKEKNLTKAFEAGLLKIMSKMGISVVRSYQNAQLFTPLGIGPELIHDYFRKLSSPVGGIGVEELVNSILEQAARAEASSPADKLPNTYQLKEHNKGLTGEKHSMTNSRSKLVHRVVQSGDAAVDTTEAYNEYLHSFESDAPVNLRHLLELVPAGSALPLDAVQSAESILSTFGSGAMSFGAISAESQRDIIRAMALIGGRSNSGEGGENPYYFRDGTAATTKQVASARFGVTAEYLMLAKEFQIKIAQGAKPGEGGQLMGVKVSVDIARARHSNTNVDLISPPPLHDIYSIEDLKELIYSLKQLKPDARVNVKLVAGANIGTIAVGVAKAGADSIHIAGHDGGTGAATITSMKHAGLPWELGLIEVHRALEANNLRKSIALRVDGGLLTGKDIVTAAILGADEFDFGKLLLVSQGCVMARICEKNTCPTGIATHNPKFKAKYKGTPEAIVTMLRALAADVRKQLAAIGCRTLGDAVGRGDRLMPHPRHEHLIRARKLDLSAFLATAGSGRVADAHGLTVAPGALNSQIARECAGQLIAGHDVAREYSISTADRAVLASLASAVANSVIEKRRAVFQAGEEVDTYPLPLGPAATARLTFRGSAGQGFGVFLTEGIAVELVGEANDSVCKSMSGGTVVIRPPEGVSFTAEENSIIGNCALYGATGGTLYVYGRAGDRFGVRNSGATAVVEGTGLHACEYMTNGTVLILGPVSHNVGAGMTGGTLFLSEEFARFVNQRYLQAVPPTSEESERCRSILNGYVQATGSRRGAELLSVCEPGTSPLVCFVPVGVAAQRSGSAAERAA